MPPKISVIIPTYNEAKYIAPCLAKLLKYSNPSEVEIILSDSPKSSDNLQVVAQKLKVRYLKCKKSGRNNQMNEGVVLARSEILYFVHADVLVNEEYVNDIIQQVKNEIDLGCYRYRFNSYPNPLLHINSFFTRFSMIWCRGGDQTLFIKKSVFASLDGFSEKHCIMEDYDIIVRSKSEHRFNIIPKNVCVSSRKYDNNNYWKVQKANFLVMRKWKSKNFNPQEVLLTYKQLLN